MNSNYEADLVARFRGADSKDASSAFRELKRIYRPKIKRRVLIFFNYKSIDNVWHDTDLMRRWEKDPDFHENLTKRIIKKAFDNRMTLRHSNFAGWIYTIQRNYCLDVWRGFKFKAKQLEMEARDKFDENIRLTASYEALNRIDREQQIRAVGEILIYLSDEHREVIELRFMSGYTYEEIASELGIPINTVKSRISRAKKVIRAKFSGFRKLI